MFLQSAASGTALGLLLLVAGDASAGSSPYLGPIPYLSAADSPFDTKTFGFCIETFEDGTFDVPGASGDGSVVGPSTLTDSVDADDGSIDGSGQQGHSYFNGGGTITITFDSNRTGGLPTEVGIVWTDGGLAAPVTFEAFGPTGTSLGLYGPFEHADLSNNGETAEDRFYGVTDGSGVSKIVVSNTGGGIEVDHLQLDRCIVCGDTNFDLDVTASDALFALKTSVGSQTCMLCVCDANDNATVSVSDALAILRKSVGIDVTLNCPSCFL
ncbi:MAG TPA: hypothetical protein VGK20_17410 [Candidatus Binatia bacterium]|jgi:hypothetical protein